MKTKKIVLVGGCFDILHLGHIQFLNQARKYGDTLTVLLESDETIKRLKGPDRPFHTQEQRKAMLLALRSVDTVIAIPPFASDAEYFEAVKHIQPDIIAFTEGGPILDKKLKQTELVGATAVVVPKIKTPSTTQLSKLLKLE